VRLIGYVSGGRPGQRLLDRLSIATSDDTVFRRVRQKPVQEMPALPVHICGIVATIRECAIAGPGQKWPASERQPQQFVNKVQLREWVTLADPSGSPFRIMWTASIPCNVRHVVENDWYPLACQTRFLEPRWPDLRGAILTTDVDVQISPDAIVLQRSGAGVSIKHQGFDCAKGGIFQMEPGRADGGTTDITHVLDDGVFYFNNPNFNCTFQSPNFVCPNFPPEPLCPAGGRITKSYFPVPPTPRVNFANDFSPKFVGRDSPRSATRLNQFGGSSIWRVASGGRMGMVTSQKTNNFLGTRPADVLLLFEIIT